MIKKKLRSTYAFVGGAFQPAQPNRGARALAPEEVQPGFKVKLKSGGPEMTIVRVLANNVCECRWNSGEEMKDQLNRFAAAALTPAIHN